MAVCYGGGADQLRCVPRPLRDGLSEEEPLGQLLRDVLWSDPTDSDQVLGVHDRYHHQRQQAGTMHVVVMLI